jgi:hypothetical protein
MGSLQHAKKVKQRHTGVVCLSSETKLLKHLRKLGGKRKEPNGMLMHAIQGLKDFLERGPNMSQIL